MEVNRARLIKRLHEVGEIGKTPDGICREAFTATYAEGVKVLKALMEEEGLSVRVDPVGNVYGRRAGKLTGKTTEGSTKGGTAAQMRTLERIAAEGSAATEESTVVGAGTAPMLVGSHLDTVRNGGLYDGALGVIAALECISVLNDEHIELDNDIEIVAFNGEEGGPLGGTFGSRTAMGNQSLELAHMDEKLEACGLSRDDIRAAKLDYAPSCYLELHIEQGIQLYREGLDIGIVEGIVGITRYKITVQGEANHAGTTPMDVRRDALVGASKLVLAINELAGQEESPFVATVGKLELIPNSVNVVPGRAELILELREMEKTRIDRFVEKMKAEAEKLCGFQITFEPYSDKGSVVLNRQLTDQMEEICRAKNLKWKRMFSGAGHDAMEIAKAAPGAMIFIPSKDGISHSKAEYSSEEDIVTGTQLLLDLIVKLNGQTR